MKKRILTFLALLPLVFTAQDKNWGIGLRGGDPSGFSFKKYMGEKALEINIGRTYMFSRRGWYDDHFYDWYHDKNYGYKEFYYLVYRASAPIAIQVHYLFQKPLKVDGLDWYWGVGGQMRYRSFAYDYRYKVYGDPNWYYARDQRVTDIDLGVDGVLGLEYTFKEVPLSLFVDANVFVELIDNPFWFHGQSGLGIRYNF